MPEGDTVFRTARRLHQALAGRDLTVCDLRWGQAATLDLAGRETVEVVARGKHILHRIAGGWTIHSHLRMEGSWRVLAPREATPRRLAAGSIRAVVADADWVCLGIRLGMLDAVPTEQEASLVGHLGPDVLGTDWDAPVALANLRAEPSRPIGEALLDQRNLAGVGTMYAAESLFLQRLNPWAPVGTLPPETVAALVDRAARLLRVNVDHAVQSTTGSRRRGEEKYAHGRSGLPCRRCGDPVRVFALGAPPRDRTMFYCPCCQGGLAPGDDGRRQAPLGTTLRAKDAATNSDSARRRSPHAGRYRPPGR
jgi:endonuclease-8